VPPRPVLVALVVLLALAAGTAAPRARAARLTAEQARLLAAAEQGLAKEQQLWWDARYGWYDEYRFSVYSSPLLMLWGAYQVFNTVNGIALADPTPENVARVRAFANGAEAYWNPAVPPTGAYAYYPHFHPTRIRYYFDDNGWFALAFLDSYRITHDSRYLRDALRAYRFLALAGWDRRRGGFWWTTYHEHKTSEPLAAAIVAGAKLYRITGDRRYLDDATRWLAWANAHSWNGDRSLYQRNATDPTVMSYVEGLMAEGNELLCKAAGTRADCARAERVATASIAAFGRDLHWSPIGDSVYLYGLLNLYALDRNTAWYSLALRNAERALATQDANGLYLTGWDGSAQGDDTRLADLGLNSATLSVFAWVAAVPAPS